MKNTWMKKAIKGIDKIIIKKQIQLSQWAVNSRFSLAGNNKGMGVIEVILIVLVLVGLAFTFKSKITSVFNTIFSKVNSKVNSF